ncbi:ester cyclase [Paraburkholderia sp. 2C]
MDGRDSVRMVENFWRQVWQSGNPDAVDKLVAEDFGITTGGVTIGSRDTFKSWAAAFLAGIDNFEFHIVEMFSSVNGDRVVTRWRVTGKNNGLMGFEPDGAPIDMTGTAVFEVREDGLLQHNWVERSALEVERNIELFRVRAA